MLKVYVLTVHKKLKSWTLRLLGLTLNMKKKNCEKNHVKYLKKNNSKTIKGYLGCLSEKTYKGSTLYGQKFVDTWQ